MDTPVTPLSDIPEDPFALHRAATAVLDHSGRVVGWSKRAEELLGYPGEEAFGRPALDFLVGPGDLPLVLDAVGESMRSETWFGVLPVMHRSGLRVELGLRARAVTRADSVREWFLIGAPAEEVIQWETDCSVLYGLFRRSPIGLAVHSPELRLLRVNRAIARVDGVPVEEHRGIPSDALLIEPDGKIVERRLRQVLETGKPAIFTEQSCRLRRDPGRERVVSVSAFRMEDPSGRILGVTEMVEDVTDRYRAQRGLALLNEASAHIGTTLDVGQTARELADVAVPGLADCVSVDLLVPVARGEDPVQGAFGPVSRMAVRSVAAEAAEVMYPVGELIHLAPDAPQARCLAERRPVLEPVLGLSPEWYSLDPERAKRALDLGVHSLMVVPLAARGQVLGLVSLWRSRRPEPFDEDDLTLAQEFVSRAAVCIDNARRFTRERTTALALQRSLLPQRLASQDAVRVAHRYLPARSGAGVGGDWFDVIPLSGARVALVVGDVVGHGLRASATMGRLRTAVRTLADVDLPPDELLVHLDDLVTHLAAEEVTTGDPDVQAITDLVATCLYVVYDPVSRRCTAASAGHPPPAIVTPDGTAEFIDTPPGPPLGLGGLPFEAAERELPPGSLLALYTDGLIKAPDRDLDSGLALLRRSLERPTRSLEASCDTLIENLLPEQPTDDVALLVARTQALDTSQVATWDVPSDPAAVAGTRAEASRRLAAWGLEDTVFTAELVVSELVTNAIRYGAPPIQLRLIRGSAVICEVSDASNTAPHLRRARIFDEGGRGLLLVAQFADRWGTRHHAGGKTIWAELALPEGRS